MTNATVPLFKILAYIVQNIFYILEFLKHSIINLIYSRYRYHLQKNWLHKYYMNAFQCLNDSRSNKCRFSIKALMISWSVRHSICSHNPCAFHLQCFVGANFDVSQ
jgi:hypothetical protein